MREIRIERFFFGLTSDPICIAAWPPIYVMEVAAIARLIYMA